MRANGKLPIFAALPERKEGSEFCFSRVEEEKRERERERERERGENEQLDDDISLILARVRVYLAAGETAHGDDHVCSESNLYFPVVVMVSFVQKYRRKNITTLSLSLCALRYTYTHILLHKKVSFLKPL